MARLPLHLESQFEQWWFVAPIDWAAANGHTEVVKELLRMDPSLFHNLTSKKRMRRLEKLWDDQDAFTDAAIGRSKVVKDLLQEFHGDQSPHTIKVSGSHPPEQHRIDRGLFKAGYGVWVLYIAAAAGDEGLVNQIIATNPELIKGDGEFGLSDLLYAAARGQKIHIFQQILTLAKRVKASQINGQSEESSLATAAIDPAVGDGIDYVGLSYNNRNIQSKAILAAARAGNVEMVRELLRDSSANATVLSFRDSNGTTALHAAAGRGHLEVVKLILELCPSSLRGQDGKGNTALHTAGRRGCLKVATEIMRFDKELIYTKNRNGETPLHSAVLGSKQPVPKLILKQGVQIEVVKQLIACNNNSVPDYINWKNNEGHTPLHLSVITANIDDKMVAFLLQSPGINVLETNKQGSTALDLARASRENYPAAEFRCNIAISLLGTAIPSTPTPTAGRPSTNGPGSAAISVDLADPLMCSFSHDITIPSDGESRSSGWRHLARRSVSVDWATDFQTAGAPPQLPAMSSTEAVGQEPPPTLPDEETLSRNLAVLRQTSAGIFEARESIGIGSPSPTQCFSTLQSFISGSTCRRTRTMGDSDQVWARALQSKKWNNFRQRTFSKEGGSPQSLRQQFSSTNNVLFHPNTPMETAELRRAPAPSIAVSPFASPSGSADRSPPFSSPSYIKSWLKTVIVHNQSPSSSVFSSPTRKPSKRQRVKRSIKQIASLTHLSFSSASETHSIHDPSDLQQSADNPSLSILDAHKMEMDKLALHMDSKLSVGSRQSSAQSHLACRHRCCCFDYLFLNMQDNMAPRIKEEETTIRAVVNEAPSLPVTKSNDTMATPLSKLPRDVESWSLEEQIVPAGEETHPLVPKPATARSRGSSRTGSPRPSISLSLSPWLSPSLRARRKREMVVPHETDGEMSEESQRLGPVPSSVSSPASKADAAAATAPMPLPLGSPLHQRAGQARHESFSLCSCGPCFQDPPESDSHRPRAKLYHAA